jgi:hypothetical protein
MVHLLELAMVVELDEAAMKEAAAQLPVATTMMEAEAVAAVQADTVQLPAVRLR